jgi:hypothetical protein
MAAVVGQVMASFSLSALYNILFVTSDDGKVQKLTNPECEVAVYAANWHSMLFVCCLQIRSLLTVLCHHLCRHRHRIHFYDGTSLWQV